MDVQALLNRYGFKMLLAGRGMTCDHQVILSKTKLNVWRKISCKGFKKKSTLSLNITKRKFSNANLSWIGFSYAKKNYTSILGDLSCFKMKAVYETVAPCHDPQSRCERRKHRRLLSTWRKAATHNGGFLFTSSDGCGHQRSGFIFVVIECQAFRIIERYIFFNLFVHFQNVFDSILTCSFLN